MERLAMREAAGQGIIAGINAALKIQGKPELILKRSGWLYWGHDR